MSDIKDENNMNEATEQPVTEQEEVKEVQSEPEVQDAEEDVSYKEDEKKDSKSAAREERRRKKEEEIEKAAEEAKKKKKSRPKLSNENTLKLKKAGKIAAGVLILLLIIKPFVTWINSTGNPNQQKGLLLLTDMTGYTEDDAMDKIHEIGFVNIKKEYIYDQFTQDGCIIKTNHHINSELKPDAEIIVYICDKSLIQKPNEVDGPSSSQETEKTYFTMDGIIVVDMAVKDNKFYAILKNNNSQAIKNIQYRIGYQDIGGSDIGENKYNLDEDYTILPGEKFRISMDVRNEYAYYLYISGLNYEKVEVPSVERN